MLEGQNICVLDLETMVSADDCKHCGRALEEHFHNSLHFEDYRPCTASSGTPRYEKIGWNDKPALGLSIGCFFDYQDGLFHWFDVPTLEATIRMFLERHPLIVSFNGRQFDGPLMSSVFLAHHPQSTDGSFWFAVERSNRWDALWAESYDILHEIWTVDPVRRFERGLNSLGAISVANGYGAKEMDGAMAPQLWRQGRYAEVITYNVSDVLKTKRLFEQIVATGAILRGDGLPLTLPAPTLPVAGACS